MSEVSVLGGGAFGLALALALSKGGTAVTLWSRNEDDVRTMNERRESGQRLPGHKLPDSLTVTHDIGLVTGNVCLLAVPMQSLKTFLRHNDLRERTLVACCKGIDLETGRGPVATIETECPSAACAILTGPSFAEDIARGLPTALTLAAKSEALGEELQNKLSRPNLRLYRTDDVIGAELGGALKNVVALAAGMAIGAGFGDSARASVIARGFAEMSRYADKKGARKETLQGLSGLGDMVLTCTSEKSRNFAAGVRFGSGQDAGGATIEGIPTASALVANANAAGVSVPLTEAVSAVTKGSINVHEAVSSLLARPARKE